jgi:hypothetical protein
VQIEHNRTGLVSLWPKSPNQFTRPAHFKISTRLLKQIQPETSVEIAIDVTTHRRLSLWIAHQPLYGQSSGIDQIRLMIPLLQQPRSIQLIAVGPCHNQNIAGSHALQSDLA